MKTSTKPTRLTFDDVLFENRNQSYGAYSLRTGYEKSLQKAVSLAGTFFLLTLWMITHSAFRPAPKDIPIPDLSDSLVLIPMPDMPLPPVPPNPENQTSDPSIPQPSAPAAAQGSTGASASSAPSPFEGNEFGEFDPAGEHGGNTTPGTPGPNREITDVVAASSATDQPLRWATVMPEFIGGEKKMREWVMTHFIIPNHLDEDQIKVQVMFVVDEAGKVDQITVKHGENARINQEAVRVVSTMPAWKPGSMNGKPVKVWYCMPIVIKLVN